MANENTSESGWKTVGHIDEPVASTWLGDHQERPSAPLIRCVKPSKFGALTNTLESEIAFL